MDKVTAATGRLFDYAYHVVDERCVRPPGDDFISLLLPANDNRDKLSDPELYDMVVLAVSGGIDRTTNQLGLAVSMFIETLGNWSCWPNSTTL